MSLANEKGAFQPIVMHELELERRAVLSKLHETYREKFKELFYTDLVPKDSLNRFLLEQISANESNSLDKLNEINMCSCISKPENIKLLDTLPKEIRTAFPLVSKPMRKLTELKPYKANRYIDEYVKVANLFLEKDAFEGSEKAKELFKDYTEKKSLSDRERAQLVKSIYEQSYLYFSEIVDKKVKEICEFLYDRLKEFQTQLESIAAKAKALKAEDRPFPTVTISNRSADIVYQEERFRITEVKYKRLLDLYQENFVKRMGFDFDENAFRSHLFSLVCRYESYFESSLQSNEGYGMQAALNNSTFAKLVKLFDVEAEMFASPLNCYFFKYCSAFLDTDIYFGSMGSFFQFKPKSGGSFACNPPFTEELIEKMADRIDFVLSSYKEAPLSFIVFSPEWLDPPTPGLVKMDKSKFLRVSLSLPANEHTYVTGAQHLVSKGFLYKAIHNSKVFFLQNDKGFSKWAPSREKIEELQAAILVSQPFDRQPERQRYESNSQNNHSFKNARRN